MESIEKVIERMKRKCISSTHGESLQLDESVMRVIKKAETLISLENEIIKYQQSNPGGNTCTIGEIVLDQLGLWG